jgi:2-isopropylmalate synthase
MKISTLDTTLRDGTQGLSISFSIEDKLRITRLLDGFGVDYIEGGRPGASAAEREFFARARGLGLGHARLSAFGPVRTLRNKVEDDLGVSTLLEAETPVVTVFGASSAAGIDGEENLRAIADTVRYLAARGREVIYDAEYFFDGWAADPAYALRTLEAARDAGAAVLCLCDTSGGTLTCRLAEICADVWARFDCPLGIHAHNDAELAVANTIAAVERGFTHVQGTVNGYGERCGVANLCSVLPNLELKLGVETVGREKLAELSSLARAVADLANVPVEARQPYIGPAAFARKGGMHLETIVARSRLAHTRPEYVGNTPRVLLSELSTAGEIEARLAACPIARGLPGAARRELVDRVAEMEAAGYDLESAGGTLELMIREARNPGQRVFEPERVDVSTRITQTGTSESSAAVVIRVRDAVYSATAEGNGPVNAMDVCLRRCLAPLYPAVAGSHVTDYKVRVLDPHKGTAARVRVLVESAGEGGTWATAGISDNLIGATWQALVDGLRLEVMRLAERRECILIGVEDHSWAV